MTSELKIKYSFSFFSPLHAGVHSILRCCSVNFMKFKICKIRCISFSEKITTFIYNYKCCE